MTGHYSSTNMVVNPRAEVIAHLTENSMWMVE